MKYLTTAKKTVTLPSGAQIEIRKLNAFDAFWESQEKDDDKRGREMTRFILLQKVGPIQFEGESALITDGEPRKGEISIRDIPMDDVNAITAAVLDFSGLNKAGQEARTTFPERQITGGSAGPVGEGIRVLADNPPKVACG